MSSYSKIKRWCNKHLGEFLGIAFGGLLPLITGLVLDSWDAYFKSLVLVLIPLSLYRMKIGIVERQFGSGFAWYISSIGLLIVSFAVIYANAGLVDPSGNLVTDAKSVIYFSIVTWTTLGYGDFRPVESVRLWAAAEAIVGYIYTGVLAGIIINLLSFDKEH